MALDSYYHENEPEYSECDCESDPEEEEEEKEEKDSEDAVKREDCDDRGFTPLKE
jgi:hypothetical protein